MIKLYPHISVMWIIFTLIVITGLSYITVMGNRKELKDLKGDIKLIVKLKKT